MESPSSRGQGWLRRFTSRPPSQAKLTLTLEAELPQGEHPSDELRLLVRHEGKITAYRPIESSLEPVPGPRRLWGRRQRWRLAFELPLSVGEDPHTTLELISDKDPETAPPESPPLHERKSSRLGVVLASATALLAGLAPGFALADGGSSSAPASAPAAVVSTAASSVPTQPPPTATSPAPVTHVTSPPPTTTSTQPAPTTTSQTPPPAPAPKPVTKPAAPTTTSTSTTSTTSTSTTTATTPTKTTTTTSQPPKTKLGGGTNTRGSGHSVGSGKAARRPDHKHAKKTKKTDKSRHSSDRHHGSGTHPAGHHSATHHARHHSGGASIAPNHHAVKKPVVDGDGDYDGDDDGTAVPVISSAGAWTTPVWTDPFTSKQLRNYAALVGGLDEPPKYLVKIYRAAGHHYRIPWQVLAAINYVETHYGQDLAVSSAGAVGWMQFMPATWSQYGQSVNLKGKPAPGMPNPFNPTDAIFAAAHYLTVAGARHNLPKAVYAYNHAGWYVQEVLSIAEQITRHGLKAGSKAHRKIAAMTSMARLLNGLPYVWGGGHGSFSLVSGGYDCSGFVSAVLHAAGYLAIPQTTQTLPSQPRIKYGPGRWVTIFDRTDAGLSSDHVIIDIDGQWWESGGWGVQSSRVHRMHKVSAAYLQSFNEVLHPKGL